MRWKKQVFGLMVGAGLAMAVAAPASAHVLVVDNGNGEPKVGWVGGADLPGKGKGLIPGGPPDDPITMSPSHAKGLNTACEALRANGNGVVSIFGPPTPAGCAHGT